MNTTTLNQSEYQPKVADRVAPVKVVDNLGFSGGPMNTTTLNQTEYQPKVADRVAPVKVVDNLGFSGGPMNTTTLKPVRVSTQSGRPSRSSESCRQLGLQWRSHEHDNFEPNRVPTQGS